MAAELKRGQDNHTVCALLVQSVFLQYLLATLSTRLHLLRLALNATSALVRFKQWRPYLYFASLFERYAWGSALWWNNGLLEQNRLSRILPLSFSWQPNNNIAMETVVMYSYGCLRAHHGSFSIGAAKEALQLPLTGFVFVLFNSSGANGRSGPLSSH